jgi:hypothetical protein
MQEDQGIENDNDAAVEAYARVLHTARQCSALLWGEREERRAEEDTPRCRLTTMAMVYFLSRLDAEDLRALWFAPGGLSAVARKPLPKRIRAGRGALADLFGPDEVTAPETPLPLQRGAEHSRPPGIRP